MKYEEWLKAIEDIFVSKGYSAEYGNATAHSYASKFHYEDQYAEPLYIVNLHISKFKLSK